MSPEFPFIAATVVALATGVRTEGGFPSGGIKALIAASVVVIIASATANTKAAPLMRALGIALLISAVAAFGRSMYRNPNPTRKDKAND